MKTFTLVMDDVYATLTDENDDEVWCSDDEGVEFAYDHDTSEADVLDFLTKTNVIDSPDDVTEIVDERGDDDSDDDADDDDDDDSDDEDDDGED